MWIIVCFAVLGSALAVPVAENCTEAAADQCIRPAATYFIQRYERLKTENLTDAKWSKDLLTQCELDQTGRECLVDFGKRCFPNQPAPQLLINGTNKSFCGDKVTKISTGCTANSSTWYAKCERPLLNRLHSYLGRKSNPISHEKIRELQKDLCCELKSYQNCLIPHANAKCDKTAARIFEDMIKDMFHAYNCDPLLLSTCPSL